MALPRLIAGIFALVLPSLQADEMAPLVDLLPECKQSEVHPLKTVLKVRNQHVWRFSTLRDVPEVARYLQQIRESAAARRFDAVLVQKIRLSDNKAPGNYSDVLVQLELFRFCDGNDALSDKSADSNNVRQINVDLGSLRLQTTVSSVFKRHGAGRYQIVPPPNMHVSLQEGAMGVKPAMTAEQVTALWGSPSVDFALQNGARLLGYGRRLWVYLDPQVKAVFTESEILSGLGRNLLEFHPEFDDKAWLVDGKVAYKADVRDAAPVLASWHKVSPLQWRKQQPGLQLRLLFEEFNPQSAAQSTAVLSNFQLSGAAPVPSDLQIRQSAQADVLDFLERASFRNLHQQPVAALLPEHLRLHHMVQRKNFGWWLPTEQLHVLLVQDEIRRLKVTSPVLRNTSQTNQIPAMLKALQIPTSKAGLRMAFPDMQDIGDRFQLYRDDFDLVIEFNSDEEQAEIEQLEIIYHYSDSGL